MENRIIKFRGKNIHTGEWIVGSLLSIEDTCFIIEKVDFDFDYRTEAHAFWFDCTEKEVDPNTVGQFTGLHDKNGKEIYEGDILGCPEDGYFLNEVVIFAEGCFMVKDDYTTTPMCAIDAQYRTVIGNIHDNPSLISDKQ